MIKREQFLQQKILGDVIFFYSQLVRSQFDNQSRTPRWNTLIYTRQRPQSENPGIEPLHHDCAVSLEIYTVDRVFFRSVRSHLLSVICIPDKNGDLTC